MSDYETRPIPFDGIELRDGECIDDYIAKARRFQFDRGIQRIPRCLA